MKETADLVLNHISPSVQEMKNSLGDAHISKNNIEWLQNKTDSQECLI